MGTFENSFAHQVKKYLYMPRWDQPFWFRILSGLLSSLFRIVVATRNLAYERGFFSAKRLGGVVISVGNITVGGTGKTPFAIWLCQFLSAKGFRPVILARGYKSGLTKGDSAAFLNGETTMSPLEGGALHADEAMMQSSKLKDIPVVIGQNRFLAAQRFQFGIGYDVTHWILDDGFQHRALIRDMDIVLIDSARMLGNRNLLPAGPLREPPSNLARADTIIVTKLGEDATNVGVVDLGNKNLLKSRMVIDGVYDRSGAKSDKSCLQSGVNLVCAIADPESFVITAQTLGAKIVSRTFVGDHEVITVADFDKEFAQDLPILTTEKDFFRQKYFFETLPNKVYVLSIAFEFLEEEEQKFLDMLQNTNALTD